MNAIVCAFELDGQVPGFEDGEQLILAEPGRALWIFPFRDRAPTGLFAFRTRDVDAQFRGDPLDVLAGDAAWCLTLYSGMGAGAGMIGAVALGDALTAHPEDLSRALAVYERSMRPLVRGHQALAYLKAQFFVPSNRVTARIRAWLLGRLTRRLLAASRVG